MIERLLEAEQAAVSDKNAQVRMAEKVLEKFYIKDEEIKTIHTFTLTVKVFH